MKKTLLAMAIPALIATSAQAVEIYKTDAAQVEFYGHLRTELESGDADIELNTGSSRAGIKAEYVLKDDLYVHGQYEFYITGNDFQDAMSSRIHVTGFGGNWGKVSAGLQWTLQEDIWNLSDVSYFFGGETVGYTYTDAGDTHSSMIRYDYEAENFTVHAAYGLEEDGKNAELMELYATTTHGALGTLVGISHASLNGDDSTTISANLSYTLDKLYVAGSVHALNSDTQDDLATYGLGAIYSVTSEIDAYGGVEFMDNDTSDTLVYAGGAYYFSDYARVYSEVGLKDFADETEVDYGVGLRVYW